MNKVQNDGTTAATEEAAAIKRTDERENIANIARGISRALDTFGWIDREVHKLCEIAEKYAKDRLTPDEKATVYGFKLCYMDSARELLATLLMYFAQALGADDDAPTQPRTRN